MNKNRFKLLFAYRNVTSNKKNSLVVMLTLSLVFSLLILILGMHHTFYKVYEYEALNRYQNIDVIVTYDEYSSSRLLNNRYIEEDYDEQINYSLSFFNIYVLIDDENTPYYGTLFSSLEHEFEILVDQDVDVDSTSTIITESYAEEHHLTIGDEISFSILGTEFQYQIVDIFPDTGLFSGVSLYIDKEAFYERFYSLSGLGNLGNTLYINAKSTTDIDQLIADIKADSHFSSYNVYPTIDTEYIESRAMDLSSMMLALGLIVLIAVIMVLDSLFPVINREYRQHLGVTNTLGGSKSFLWQVNLIHWLIYTLISFAIGALLSLILINYGLHVYGLVGFIEIQPQALLLSLGIVIIFIVVRAYIGFQQENRMSVASQSRNRRYLKYHPKYAIFAVVLILFLLEYFLEPFSLKWHSFILVILSIYLALNLSSMLLQGFSSLLGKTKKKTVFKLFHLKYLGTNKHIHQSMRVLLISLISLVLIFSVRSFLFAEIIDFQDSMTYDLAMTNIYDYDQTLEDDVSSLEVTTIDPSAFYQDVVIYLNEDDYQPCKFFVSMEYTSFQNYFDVEEYQIDTDYTNGSIPYVILPGNFRLVYDLKPGDIVTMDLNYKIQGVSMVVAGFFDTDFDNLIYSDILLRTEYSDIVIPNTIFFTTNDKEALYNSLVQTYSVNLYFVLDPDLYFKDYIASARSVIDFFSVFTIFMMACFIVIIFNNTLLMYYGLKSDIARMKVLGAGVITFARNLMKEYLVLLIVVFIVGIIEIRILSEYLKYVVLLTDYYKNITSTPLTITYGYGIVSVVLILSYVYYFDKIYRTKIIEEIKIS